MAGQLGKRAISDGGTSAFSAYQTVPPPPQLSYSYYPNWRVDNDSWYNIGALVGPALYLPLGKANRLSFTASLAVGAAYISMPKLNAKSDTDTSAAHITQGGASAVALAIFARSGVNYRLNKKLSLVVSIGYSASGNAKFYNIEESISVRHGGTNYLSPNSSFYQKTLLNTQMQSVSSVNINAGVAFSL